jgi:rare lipoprotein A
MSYLPRFVWRLPLLALIAGLTACGGGSYVNRDSGPSRPVDVSHIPDAVPKVEPKSRYGNPSSYVVFGKRYYVKDSSAGHVERGIASWYGNKFHGRRTSSGEPYDMYAMTAAHKTLPLPTYARVTNLRNGRAVVVKINDRGPFHENRIIDLSYAAARKLGIDKAGTGLVEVRALDPRRPAEPTRYEAAAPAPRPVAKVAINGPDMYLQVGAFSSRYNAERLKVRLSEVSLPGIHILPGYANQQPVFRVRIGPISSVEEADRMASMLAQFGISSPHVVID